jgi:hypothetical protein
MMPVANAPPADARERRNRNAEIRMFFDLEYIFQL